MRPLREIDALRAAAQVGALWEGLRGGRVFMTGATGFLGGTLVESFLHANRIHRLAAKLTILSRNPDAALSRQPWLADRAISLLRGDIRSFPPPGGRFSHCVHAAGVANIPLERQTDDSIRGTIIQGTRRCLQAADAAGVRRFLFLSSGAVYGPQPKSVRRITEDSVQSPLPASSQGVYAQAKREAESLCLGFRSHHLQPIIARGFVFLGPGIPLRAHYAAGNFIGDAMAGGPIEVAGDGTSVRSCLYSAEGAAWLWTILLKGKPRRIFNVGSSEEISTAELANLVARCAGGLDVIIHGRALSGRPQRYVPSVRRASQELGLRPRYGPEQAIKRTIAWVKGRHALGLDS